MGLARFHSQESSFGRACTVYTYSLGVQDRKIKMVFNTGGTWRRVTFEKLMMKIYDFF